ncbi:histone-lysine N-methyltransferase SETMAR [Plakobranchus ocellatus]|uniref:Histone-lysine N-methyltransferase SETMAR n=1 Tax=Plakobranchus ocellatus TaxID=259542 RepID=A0AAV3YNY1_9GAST|nr:histone-lysine N-methyltransferase SETMAR [Plakobranchus ocellatus]
MVLWSDSCVPGNRSRLMSIALLDFLNMHPEDETISQKFSETGHACIQEMNAALSSIDAAMKKTKLFSPVEMIRMLTSVKRNHIFNVIELQDKDFLNIQLVAQFTSVDKMLFSQVKQLIYSTQQPYSISYKL